MKKLLIAIAFVAISCSADTEQTSQSNCACYKVYYDYKPISYQGGTWIWGYV